MEAAVIRLFDEGLDDPSIAKKLSQQGYRSPLNTQVLASTVQTIRLQHGLLRKASQSHPLKVKGYLSISQLATALAVSPYWFYDRINNGAIQIDKRPGKHAYLFLDEPATLQQLQHLKDGSLHQVDFRRRYQDA